MKKINAGFNMEEYWDIIASAVDALADLGNSGKLPRDEITWNGKHVNFQDENKHLRSYLSDILKDLEKTIKYMERERD